MLQKSLYVLCAAAVLAIVVAMVSDQRTGWADECEACSGDECGWSSLPTATDAVTGGAFDTATDGDDDELQVAWCFESGNPIGGIFEFVPNNSGSFNIEDNPEPVYTPSSFLTGACTGNQTVFVAGSLENPSNDGTLRSKVLIGASPGCGQSVTKDLAINKP